LEDQPIQPLACRQPRRRRRNRDLAADDLPAGRYRILSPHPPSPCIQPDRGGRTRAAVCARLTAWRNAPVCTHVARRGSSTMIRTGEQFLESIRDGRRVLCGGEMIDDLTTHPKTRGYAHAVAEYYDMHHDPAHQDVLTFVDENGERWAKHWFLPRNKQDLVARREYHDYVFRHWARVGMFPRPPASMLPVFYTLYQDPEPWESESRGHDGRPLAQNIRDKWEYMKANDFSASPMFLDVQGD